MCLGSFLAVSPGAAQGRPVLRRGRGHRAIMVVHVRWRAGIGQSLRGRVGMGYETVTAVPMYNGARNLMMLYAELGMNQRNAGVIIAFQCVNFPG